MKYPQKSFVYFFQTTKEGHFRAANSFQHDVDVVLEIPERGKAEQFGRFNQGGNRITNAKSRFNVHLREAIK